MRFLFLLLCLFPSICSAAMRAVEGATTGRLPQNPPIPWVNEPISVSVADNGDCTIEVSGDFDVQGVLSANDLRLATSDLEKSQIWARTVRETGEEGRWNLGTYTGYVGNIRTGVNLKFFSANRGNQTDVIMLVDDYRSDRTVELYLNEHQVTALLSLLVKAPLTRDELVFDLQPKAAPRVAWLTIAIGGLTLIGSTAWLIRAHRTLVRKNAEVDKQSRTIVALTGDVGSLNERASALAEQVQELQREKTTWCNERAKKEQTVRDLLHQIEGRRNRELVSERMLVAAFIQLFTFKRDAYWTDTIAGIHDLSQALEQKLGDVLAHARSRFILIEFKKAISGFRREVTDKADIREPQIQTIRSKPEWVAISMKCHFGAWGSTNPLSLIEFTEYLTAWDAANAKKAPAANATLSEFIDGFLPPLGSEARFGAEAQHFREYVKLLENHGTRSGTTSETCPFMLVVRTNAGEPQFVPVPNLDELISLVKRIEVRLARELAEKAAAAEKQRQEEMQRAKRNPPGHSPGWTR